VRKTCRPEKAIMWAQQEDVGGRGGKRSGGGRNTVSASITLIDVMPFDFSVSLGLTPMTSQFAFARGSPRG